MSVSTRYWRDSTLVMLLHEMAFKWADGCPKTYARLLQDLLTSNGLPSLIIPKSLTQLRPLTLVTVRDVEINTSIHHEPGPQMPCNENTLGAEIDHELGLYLPCDDNKPEAEIQNKKVPLPPCTGDISVSDMVHESETRLGWHSCTLNQLRVRYEADPALPHTEAGIRTVSKSSPASFGWDEYSDNVNHDSGRSITTDLEQYNAVPSRVRHEADAALPHTDAAIEKVSEPSPSSFELDDNHDTSGCDSDRSSINDREQHTAIASREHIDRHTLSQDYLTSIVNLPVFDKAVIGHFVRHYVKIKNNKVPTSIVAEITDVVECPQIYELGNTTTNKRLKLRHGTHDIDYQFSLRGVSNSPFTQSEYEDWVDDSLFC